MTAGEHHPLPTLLQTSPPPHHPIPLRSLSPSQRLSASTLLPLLPHPPSPLTSVHEALTPPPPLPNPPFIATPPHTHSLMVSEGYGDGDGDLTPIWQVHKAAEVSFVEQSPFFSCLLFFLLFSFFVVAPITAKSIFYFLSSTLDSFPSLNDGHWIKLYSKNDVIFLCFFFLSLYFSGTIIVHWTTHWNS